MRLGMTTKALIKYVIKEGNVWKVRTWLAVADEDGLALTNAWPRLECRRENAWIVYDCMQ